ncbi:MAG: preprotein translocase subunit SecG [Cyclobacteriaceae bacterium]
MYILILSIILVAAVLLVLVVLAQNPKGGGLSSQFGGAGGSQVMGVKKTSDLLEKLTWGLIVAIMVLTISTKFFIGGINTESDNPLINGSSQETTAPVINPGADQGSSLDDLTEPDTTGGN